MYLLALEPPANPDTGPQDVVSAGERSFNEQGCGGCHAPLDYTNGSLTLAEGFEAPPDHPNREDIAGIFVGTDAGLALRTRKGTGFYKVPSLRGLWYRPFLLHDGSVASLDELFDPGRLSPEHLPGGWKEPGTERRAVSGHRYGLDLRAEDKEALLAFVRSL